MKIKNKSIIAIAILSIIIVILLICLIISKKSNTNSSVNKSNGLQIVNYSYVEHDENVLMVEVKNNSSETYSNINPYVIFYDSNNIPFGMDYDATVNNFEAGTTRYFYFSRAFKDFSRIEIGLFPNTFVETAQTNLYKDITYNVENLEDENGDKRIIISGENKSDKKAYLIYQIGYYSNNELFYYENFITYAESNSKFEEPSYLKNKFYNGDPFPEDYTSKVILAEAFELPQVNYEASETETPNEENIENESNVVEIN